MFDPRSPDFDKEAAERLLLNKEVIIVFLPSAKLRELIAKGEHPIARSLGSNIKKVFLEGEGIVIQKRLVWEYVHGTLDEKHAWIFKHGEVKIADDWSKLEDRVIRRK